ncbi:hypothetical protein [Sphingomonas sp. CFBP 8760]|uniref:hypothetical protein n=1 Tax=Sphingomonas sp. CFBP 8760 TaxID=2775282 RepID=UPI00177FC1C4|nr:hypothetical protein [Sphingomonas sp. CFBP 8760]MBD8545805.1 hypothetical protein [Sphingomonas sp. CFBP 8760]
MSADGASRRAGRRPVLLVLAVLIALVAAVAVWALVPRDLGPVTVERVRLLPAGAPDGGTKPAALATPVRIAVTFVVPQDLAAVREGLGLGYIAARLADCGDDDAATQEVIAQRAGYLGDYGRVIRLGTGADGRTRYRAVFDDELTATVDHAARRTPARATPGGLCLSLYGASMWFRHATSPAMPIATLPR